VEGFFYPFFKNLSLPLIDFARSLMNSAKTLNDKVIVPPEKINRKTIIVSKDI
jgi:hypothetical protein